MSKKFLLTSFDTWLPHHKSNSADDLLIEIARKVFLPHSLFFLRQLPVDIEQASSCAIAKIKELQPDVIICCGMAERRTQLSVESNATFGDSVLTTAVDLQELVTGSTGIEISHNAGKFVCEGLYYKVLKYLEENQPHSHCIFVHVPLLTLSNVADIRPSFLLILQKIASLPLLN